jgi:anti-sigma regulatory factor (Ser/Thr protein kinase)
MKAQGQKSVAALDEASSPVRLQLDLSSGLTSIHYAIVAVRAWCDLTEIASGVAWKIELAVAEVLSNIAVHGYRQQPDQPITLVWHKERDLLRIEIRDRGLAMASFPGKEFPDTAAEHGRGWPIIQACMDRIGYRAENGVNVLTLERDLPAA